jgi:hypothetical protein
MLSVIPTALLAIAFFDQSGGNTNALAERLISHAFNRQCRRHRPPNFRNNRE